MVKALTKFSARVARPPASEPDAVILEIIASALGDSGPGNKVAEHAHDCSESELVHIAAAADASHVVLPPRPRPRQRKRAS